MDGLDQVLEALAAGAAAGAGGVASTAVEDAYTTLKRRLRELLGDHAGAQRTLDACHSTDPAEWRDRLGKTLAASGAADDEQIRVAARQVLQPREVPVTFNAPGNHQGFGIFQGPVTFNPPAAPAAR